MADAGVSPLGQADIAVLARVCGIALSAGRPEQAARSVTRMADRHGLRSRAGLARRCPRSPAALAERTDQARPGPPGSGTVPAGLRPGGVLPPGRAERLLRPERFGLAAAHAYREEAACGAA